MTTSAVLQWVRVTAEPGSVKTVRDFVEDCCRKWDLEATTDVAVLLASELATNAVRYARTPMTVWLGRRSDRIVLSVEDAAGGSVTVRHPGVLDETGRGLELVEALAERWGEQELPAGKRVWAEIATNPRLLDADAGHGQ